jgi:hypothetical protein
MPRIRGTNADPQADDPFMVCQSVSEVIGLVYAELGEPALRELMDVCLNNPWRPISRECLLRAANELSVVGRKVRKFRTASKIVLAASRTALPKAELGECCDFPEDIAILEHWYENRLTAKAPD